MAKIYSWRFRVRTYELEASGQVRPPIYLNYLEEGASQASASLGYDQEWYTRHKRMWVVRNMTLRYYEPALLGDELELYTWVSDFRRVQSHREYDLRRVNDETPILRARANWVFLNTETMQPQRLSDDIIAEFDPTGELEDLDVAVVDPIPIEEPVIHTEERRVQYYELDSQGHVNNAVYLTWAHQSMTNALRAVGWPPERLAGSGFAMQAHADEIEYSRSALDDEPIWIVTRLAEIGRDRAAWHTEIRHGATGELIAKNVSIRVFYDARGPRSIPDALHLPLMQRTRL
jgi:YbgC/YbaW family acyl-CoA thioester hydrolase